MEPHYQQKSQDPNVDSPTTLLTHPSEAIDPTWYLETGASNHITHDFFVLSLHSPYKGKANVAVGLG